MNASAAVRAVATVALGFWCTAPPAGAAPSRPGACQEVPAGAPLQVLLDRAAPGDALCLAPGEHAGPLRLSRRVTLFGPRGARVVSRGAGSTITVAAPGAALQGFSVDGSGGRFERLDAAVRIEADGVRVEALHIAGALFGILVEKAAHVAIVENEIDGNAAKALGLRGDAIRLWEVRHSEVLRNRVRDARDVVAWYAPDNRFEGNRIERGRYGLHFMYSHRCAVLRNRFEANVVGVFSMYSRGLEIRENTILRSGGAAGIGIGVKESGDLRVAANELVDNTVGFYVDNSPLQESEHNWFLGNRLSFHDRAVVFHGGAARNHFLGNVLRESALHVVQDARGDAQAAEWRGNSFDDYAGYDLDGDGTGDLPYELRSLASDWTGRAPSLAFFRGTPALAFAEWLGHSVPLFRPSTILVDPEPRMPFGAARAD